MANTVTISAGQDFPIILDFGTTDINGYKFYATIKRDCSMDDTSAVATQNVTVSGSAYTVTMPFTGAQLAGLYGTYYYDVKVVTPAGAKFLVPESGPDTLVIANPATKRSS
jgi:hypothetical protein